MNREIEFRGQTINDEWVFGLLTILRKPYNHVETGYYISNSVGYPFAFKVRPGTVGQFIGLNDKNNKKIFEGDKVIIADSLKGIVKFDNDTASFRIFISENSSIGLSKEIKGIKVIDNIHESEN